MNNIRIECSNQQCRRVMRESELVTTRVKGTVHYKGCPECSCESYYKLEEPVTNERIDHANELIRLIASYGRKFFEHKGFVSTLELGKNGRVLFVDYYTQRRIDTHRKGHWNGFTSGGTLKGLVEQMRDYVKTGRPIPLYFIGCYRDNGSNIWGYEEAEIQKLRAAVAGLPIIKNNEQVSA
ncbi:MAG: hypothetical protein K2W88_01395 [Pararheinheimera sp.]|nr:hypothetical protein [Rheinheimera sp.]